MSLAFLIFVLFIITLGFVFKKQHQIKQLKSYAKKIETELGKRHKYQEKVLKDMTRSSDAAPLAAALIDTLTGLPGREAFEDRLTQALHQLRRHKIPLAIMIIDISRFSEINKEFGHDSSDKLLIEVSNRLKKIIRQVDTVSRYVGDKFIILLPLLVKPETAAYVAQRIQDNMIPVFVIDEKNIQINVRIGIAVSPLDGEDKEPLLQHAESALQRAKQEGNSAYHFYRQEIQILSKRELSLSAIFRDPAYLQNLLVYYQPYMNVTSNEVECIQAIPYFQHPELQIVRFSEFEKIAENAGKIIEIGETVLLQGIQQFQKWNLQNFKTKKLLVNLYLRQIENIPFIEKVIQMIRDQKTDPTTLIFLVSEDALSASPSTIEQAFTLLDQEGVQMAIGIFALGHLSLQKISHLPFKYLKIDGRLVQSISQKQSSESILSMLIDLAKTSKIQILAEGVDNNNQKMMLSQLGCDVMQGQLFCRPLPADSVEIFKIAV